MPSISLLIASGADCSRAITSIAANVSSARCLIAGSLRAKSSRTHWGMRSRIEQKAVAVPVMRPLWSLTAFHAMPGGSARIHVRPFFANTQSRCTASLGIFMDPFAEKRRAMRADGRRQIGFCVKIRLAGRWIGAALTARAPLYPRCRREAVVSFRLFAQTHRKAIVTHVRQSRYRFHAIKPHATCCRAPDQG